MVSPILAALAHGVPDFSILVDGGGYDYAHADGHGAYQDRQRDIFVFYNLLPEMVRRQLVDSDEGSRENQNAERARTRWRSAKLRDGIRS